MDTQENEAALRQFTGSEHWYRHALNCAVLYTDGAKYVGDEGGAYWLLDEIALAQRFAVTREEFHVWTRGAPSKRRHRSKRPTH